MSATDTYRSFVEALNAKDLDAAAELVDLERYQENCVGFTPGFVGWPEARSSLEKVWEGIPDLRVELVDVHGDATTALARGRVHGTNTGRLYGVPATKRPYTVTFFDSVEVEGGRLVRRVQQADVITQMRQLYGRGVGSMGLVSCLFRVDPAAPVL
jgi:predicted ester cyclase